MEDEESIKYFTKEEITKLRLGDDPNGCAELIREVIKKAMIKKYNLDYANLDDRIFIDQEILDSVVEWKRIITSSSLRKKDISQFLHSARVVKKKQLKS